MYTMYMYRAEAMAARATILNAPCLDFAWLCKSPSRAHAGAAQRSMSQATMVPAAQQYKLSHRSAVNRQLSQHQG